MTSNFGPRTSDVFVIPDSAALHSGYDTATRISLQRPLNLPRYSRKSRTSPIPLHISESAHAGQVRYSAWFGVPFRCWSLPTFGDCTGRRVDGGLPMSFALRETKKWHGRRATRRTHPCQDQKRSACTWGNGSLPSFPRSACNRPISNQRDNCAFQDRNPKGRLDDSLLLDLLRNLIERFQLLVLRCPLTLRLWEFDLQDLASCVSRGLEE